MLQQKNIYRKMIDKSDWRAVNLNGILRYFNSQPHVISGKHSSHQPLLTFYLWCCSACGQHRGELCAEWAYIKKDLREGQETVKRWSKTALLGLLSDLCNNIRWGKRAPKNWCFSTVVWRKLLRVPWMARRSNQSILKEISPEYSLEGLMLKLKL